MKKRILAVLGVVLLTIGLGGCGSTSNVTTLIMADVQEGDHPTAKASDEFARLVEKRTNGRIKVEVYHGSTLGTEAQQGAQVTVGGIDFARLSSSVISNYDKQLKGLQALYLYKSEDSMWSVMDGNVGQKLLASDELSNNGIVGLCWFSGGSRNFYNNQKVVSSPKDLAGLTLRVNTDSMFAFLEASGAKGINVAYGDIYNSITAGVIDGAENNWPSYISTGHYEVAKYITIDEHTRIPEMIVASKATMDSLSPADQQIIKECAVEASKLQRKWMNEFNDEAIKTAEAAGVTITYLNESQVKEFQDIAAPVNAKVSADYISLINDIIAAQ